MHSTQAGWKKRKSQAWNRARSCDVLFWRKRTWPPTFLAWKEARFSRSEDSMSWVSSLDSALQWSSSHYSRLKQTSLLVCWPLGEGHAGVLHKQVPCRDTGDRGNEGSRKLFSSYAGVTHQAATSNLHTCGIMHTVAEIRKRTIFFMLNLT